MDFSWSEEQLAFKDKVIQFAQEALNHDVVEREQRGEFSYENWQKCAEFGIQGLVIPAEYGGCQTDLLTSTLAMEALGYGCRDNGLTLGLNAQMWTVQLLILKFGTEEQKLKYLPDLCAGEKIGAIGITEPDAGSDIFSLRTHAEKRENGYLVNGAKRFITLAPVADIFVVFATIDPNVGRWGITAFLVERDTPGFTVSEMQNKMGLRTLPLGELAFEDCLLTLESRLGPEGAGVSLQGESLEWERSCMLASQLGAMERQLETSADYSRSRRQFDQPIGSFQSVSNRLADMKVRLETARLLLYKAAWLKSTGQSAMMETALAKLCLTESYLQSSQDAIRIHGGNGYMSEFGIECDLRDAVGGILYGGTSDIQRNIIARQLMKPRRRRRKKSQQ